MKIKSGFVLRKVAGEHVVMPIGQASRLLNGLIKLNDSGAFLWRILVNDAKKDELIAALQSEYGITQEQAAQDVEAFLETLSSVGCIMD